MCAWVVLCGERSSLVPSSSLLQHPFITLYSKFDAPEEWWDASSGGSVPLPPHCNEIAWQACRLSKVAQWWAQPSWWNKGLEFSGFAVILFTLNYSWGLKKSLPALPVAVMPWALLEAGRGVLGVEVTVCWYSGNESNEVKENKQTNKHAIVMETLSMARRRCAEV